MPSQHNDTFPSVLFFEPPLGKQTGGLQAALGSLRTELENAGVDLYPSNALPEKPLPGTIAHFHGLWQPAHARMAKKCRELGIPYLVSPHGMLEPWAWHHKHWKKLLYFHFIERRFLAAAECLLATANAEARNLAGLFPNARIETIPLGMTGSARPDYQSARHKLGWDFNEWILLFLSRIHEKKGLEFLLDALVDLKGDLPIAMRLVIVGGGESKYVENLQAKCSRQRHELPKIDWHGEIWGDEKWKYFQGADLFCLPTHSENFGLAVLEACQVGTPALTTTTTPWSSILTEGRGYIAEPNVASVKVALKAAFHDGKANDARREALADWAHDTFSWDCLTQRYAALYGELCRG